MEQWKFYKESYNSRWGKRVYEISDEGNVKINGVLVKEFHISKNGYYHIGKIAIHRAVAELFVTNPDPEHYNCVDHINGIKTDNRAENLRWCDQKMNVNNPITYPRFINAIKSEERNLKISNSLKITFSKPEVKRRCREAQLRPEVRKRKVEAMLDHVWMCNGIDTVFPHKDNADYYLSLGYHFGRK